MAVAKIFMLACAVIIIGCAVPPVATQTIPIADRGLIRIDQLSATELRQAVIASLVRNPNLKDRSQFASTCYRDLAAERKARISARIKPETVDADISVLALDRNDEILKKYPQTKFWIRQKVEARTPAIAFANEDLSLFSVSVELPANKELRDFSETNIIEKKWKMKAMQSRRLDLRASASRLLTRFGPLVVNEEKDSFPECHILFDVPKVNLKIPVNKSEYQRHLYESSRAGRDLEFTADVDVEYDFSICSLSDCTPRVSAQNVRNSKFGWDPR